MTTITRDDKIYHTLVMYGAHCFPRCDLNIHAGSILGFAMWYGNWKQTDEPVTCRRCLKMENDEFAKSTDKASKQSDRERDKETD